MIETKEILNRMSALDDATLSEINDAINDAFRRNREAIVHIRGDLIPELEEIFERMAVLENENEILKAELTIEREKRYDGRKETDSDDGTGRAAGGRD